MFLYKKNDFGFSNAGGFYHSWNISHPMETWRLVLLKDTKVSEPIKSTQTLEDVLDHLLSSIPQTEETTITIKLHRKVDEAATRTETITGPTVYACLQSLAEAHELKWSIRKGTLNVRPR